MSEYTQDAVEALDDFEHKNRPQVSEGDFL